jgi:hypothetical protein
MIPLTCNEIRHLRAAFTRPRHTPDHITRWSRYRRRHQHASDSATTGRDSNEITIYGCSTSDVINLIARGRIALR